MRKLSLVMLLVLLSFGCGGPEVGTGTVEPTDVVESAGTPMPAARKIVQGPTAAPSTPESAISAYVPTFEVAPCPFEIPAGQVEGENVDCGYLVVPENRADPTTRSIRLAVAILRHPDGEPEPDPIIYLEGGPGGSPLELRGPNLDASFGPVFAANRDIILFDQRGVGYSEPALDCPGYTDLYLDLLDHEVDGVTLTAEEILDRKVEAFTKCARELQAVADLSAFNTVQNAADVNDLRLVLGYDQVNLWGGSYGTRLALGVMRDYPEGVRSVVLDAPYTPDVDLYLDTPRSFDRALSVLCEECGADDACNAAYPDLRTVLFATVDRLNRTPASIDVFHPLTGRSYSKLLDGDELLELVFRSLYDTAMRPLLPQAIYDANKGTFRLFLPTAMFDILRQEIRSWGMYFSVVCNEEVPFSDLAGFQAVLAEYPEFAGFFAGFEVGGLSYAVCPGWDSGQADDLENQPITSDIPTLILAGEYDPIVPVNWGEEACRTLTNSHFFVYPGIGHGATASECPRSMMIAFLKNPTVSPDDACIGEAEVEAFVVPVEAGEVTMEPFTSEDPSLTGVVPVGWTEVQPGVYARGSSVADIVVMQLTIAPMSPEEFLYIVTQQYGLEEAPKNLGQRDGDGLTWSLYSFEMQGMSRDLGLAAYEEQTLVMILRSAPEEREALHEAVFLPVLDALAPLAAE